MKTLERPKEALKEPVQTSEVIDVTEVWRVTCTGNKHGEDGYCREYQFAGQMFGDTGAMTDEGFRALERTEREMLSDHAQTGCIEQPKSERVKRV